MNKKKKIKITVLIVLAVVACGGITAAVINYQKHKPVPFESTDSPEEFVLIEKGEQTEGSFCLVRDDGGYLGYDIVFDDYICLESYKGKKYLSDNNKKYIEEYEQYVLDFYNLDTGEIEKSIDLVEIAGEYTPGKQYYSSVGISTQMSGVKRYLRWMVTSVEDTHDRESWEGMNYDLDEGRRVDDSVWDYEEEFTEEEKAYIKSTDILWEDKYCNFLEINQLTRENGINIFPSKVGIIYVRIKVSQLPEENSRLYQEFPELKKYKDEVGTGRAELILSGYPTAEEIVEMLKEDGYKTQFSGYVETGYDVDKPEGERQIYTYTDCILDGFRSKDGKSHKINSIEDYIEWYNWKNYF